MSLAFLVAAGSAFGSETTKISDTPAVRKESFRDIQLAKKVRDALKEDKQLDLSKLFVRVKDRVAILEGKIASEEQLRQAERRVKKVSGIAEVHTSLVTVVAPKIDDELTIPLLIDPPTRTETRFQDRGNDAVIRPIVLPHITEPIPEVVAVRLEPPIPLVPEHRLEPILTMRTKSPLTDDVVTAAVERACHSNPRFRLLDVEVRGELVWLRGTVEQLNTGMEFAQALTDLGVRHVVIQCTQADRP